MDAKVIIIFLQLFLFSTGVMSFFLSLKKVKSNQFYSDTPQLLPLGIYVWGDALILGPFWMIVSVFLSFLTPLEILRFAMIFLGVRSMYEVIYWITHQVAQRDYNPPLFRRFKGIGPNESAILYQLLHTCVCILCSMGLLLTFR